MKQISTLNCRALRLFTTVLLLLMVSVAANAYSFKVDGIYYNISSSSNKTCEVTYKSYSSSRHTYSSDYSGNVVIPETVTYNGTTYSVTSIGDYAFYQCTLTEVTIPNSVKGIGRYAFLYCSGPTSITIPNSVVTICEGAFYHCTKMTQVTIGESVTSIRVNAFRGCTGLTEMTIPNSVTLIEGMAFEDCTSLTEVTIPNSVTSIGIGAFAGCTGLTEVNFNATACTYAGSASSGPIFGGCSNLYIMNFGDKVTRIPAYLCYKLTELTEITIPNSVATIGTSAFESCTGLTSLTIGEGVTEIGSYAFEYCTGLTSVTIPSGVTSLYWDAFRGCTSLKSLTFEDGGHTLNVGSSGNYYSSPSFSYLESLYLGRDLSYSNSDSSNKGCYSPFATTTTLSSVTIGEKVSQLPDYLFYNCTGLSGLTIPNSVKTIGDYAFYDCDGLTSVGIGNGVTSIGDSAFYNCRAMRELSIGSRVATIGNSAFDSCRRLESLTSLNTTPPTCSASGNGVFYNVPVKTCTLYVTEGSKDAYASAYAWEDFLTIIDNQVDAIEGIMTNGSAEAMGYYTLDGKQVPTPQRGINIIRYSDGTARKVLLK